MVAQAVSNSKKITQGVRPFDAVRDLNGVAHLLEEAFRADNTFPLANIPFLREVGIFLWTLSYAPIFPEHIAGFVWVEDGKIVGNVTFAPEEGWLDRYLISNVAVKSSYQRRGIARQLMIATLDELRARRAQWALLNVRPTNPDAVKLYTDLGFNEVELRSEWVLSSPASPSPRRGGGRELGVGGEVRPLRLADERATIELVRAAMSAKVLQFRAPRLNELALHWDDRLAESITDFFIGQVTHRWALEQNGRLAAVVVTHRQRITSPHRITVHVHPDFRGQREDDLVEFARRDVAQFPPREIRAFASSTHPELIAALERGGFKLVNGLTLMAMAL